MKKFWKNFEIFEKSDGFFVTREDLNNKVLFWLLVLLYLGKLWCPLVLYLVTRLPCLQGVIWPMQVLLVSRGGTKLGAWLANSLEGWYWLPLFILLRIVTWKGFSFCIYFWRKCIWVEIKGWKIKVERDRGTFTGSQRGLVKVEKGDNKGKNEKKGTLKV